MDCAAGEHGDEAEVAGDERVVRRLHRGDGGLARLDRVKEVAMVAGRGEDRLRDELLGQWAFFQPLGIAGVEAGAVDPDPAVGANPLGAGGDGG